MTTLSALLTRAGGAMLKPGKDMRRAIATAHSAAYYAALKERTGVMPKGLSKVERAELKARVSEQLRYYDAFAEQAGDMSDTAVAARAQMYAGAIRATYGQARYPGLNQYPGDGQTKCLTNCNCDLSEEDDGIHWTLNAGESCDDCQAMAAGGPYQVEGMEIKAQTDEERAMFAKMGGGKGPGKGYDKSKSTLKDDKAKGGGAPSHLSGDEAKQALKQKVRLNTDERTSVNWYSHVGHDKINNALRGNAKMDQHTLDRTTGNLDQVMQRHRTSADVEVHRGMLSEDEAGHAHLASLKPGETYKDKGYVSTTTDKGTAKNFGYGGKGQDGTTAVSMDIRVPKGTPALHMGSARPHQGVDESEVLLGRNLNYRVVSRKDTPGHAHLTVEVVPGGH